MPNSPRIWVGIALIYRNFCGLWEPDWAIEFMNMPIRQNGYFFGKIGQRALGAVCTFAIVVVAMAFQTASVRAQDVSQQEQLFQQMMLQPGSHDLTFAYVRVATARGDYEAAIGALERLLFYNPNLVQVKYELGSLYFRLGSFEMARRYFKEALASPNFDPTTRGRIEAYLPDTEKQLQQSRLSGFVQAGIRTQSNASFAPSGSLLRLGGADFALLPTAQKKSDVNGFGLVGVSHDYDLNNRRGDLLETRFVGYLTAQDRFEQLNVGLFDVSFGPRFQLPELLPGASIKPYVVGGNTWVGGQNYLSSGGAGVSLRLPFTMQWTVQPEFEWRQNSFSLGNTATVATFNSGATYTGALSSSYQIAQPLRLDTRGVVRRGESGFNFQSFDQRGLEAALIYEFAPPFASITRNWSIAPFVKYIETRFDAPNPFIDPLVLRRDTQWSVGGILNTPINTTFGISTAVQFDKVNSNLPNYRLDNFSVIIGPTARF